MRIRDGSENRVTRCLQLVLLAVGMSAIWLAAPPRTFAQGRSAARDAAIERIMNGCRGGHWLDCSRVEEYLPAGSPDILEAGLRGCELEDRGGCFSAAKYYQQYSKDPNHLSLAVKYFKRSCDEGLQDACGRLVGSSAWRSRRRSDARDVLQSNEKQCSSGDAAACNWMGIAYSRGETVPIDTVEGVQFLRSWLQIGR